MYAGLAGGLLVFTRFWHVTEWLMDEAAVERLDA